ncbi:MAG: CvpA family protein [Deltaproteobacteria bacterium]|nr:CvpA family protein [Deltaproteobacteria bacterium]
MNSLDIAFLILIGVSTLYSLWRGLVREIFSLLAIILGFLGAGYGYSHPASWLRGWGLGPTAAQILGFAVLFLILALAISLLGRFLSGMMKRMDLSWADRLGGAAFGLLKGVLFVAVILLVLTAFLPVRSQVLAQSKISPGVLAVARGLSFLVPEGLGALYAGKEKELKRYWALRELAGGKAGPGQRKGE